MIKATLSCLLVCMYCAVYACTGCGTSISGGGIGLLNSSPRSLVYTSWNTAKFTSNKQSDHDLTDIFHTWNISVKHQLGDKFSLVASQSYKFNKRKDLKTQTNSGFGDVQLIGQYTLLDELIGKSNFIINTGLGINLPVGKYEAKIHERNLPENFNPSTGSYAGIAQINVGIFYGANSFFTNNTFRYNLPTKTGYTFGNQISSKATAYRSFILPNAWNILASGGIQYEHIFVDTYKNNTDVDGTDGSGLFGSVGIGFQTSTWQINAEVLAPIITNYVSNEMDAQMRTNIEFVYFLN